MRPSSTSSTILANAPWRFLRGPLKGDCRVVFAGPHFHAAIPSVRHELERREVCSVDLIHAPTQQLLHQHARTAHVALPFMERFPSDLFRPDATPDLRLVVQFGVGLEGVDLPAATMAGVAVSNIPADNGTHNAEATSEHAVYLAMSLLRHAVHDLPRRFQDRSLGGLPIPRTLYGKRVTVVGFGAVGSCLARYLVAMGADVTVVRRNWPGDAQSLMVLEQITKSTSLEEVLPTTQVLILACPLNESTLHLIGSRTIGLLPRGALVVNVARGGLVQYHPMLEALKSGAVGGFASDVGIGHPSKPSEPWDPDDEISQLPSTLFTPHVGGYTDVAYSSMSERVVDAIEHAIRGDPPPVWVNNPDQ